MVQVILVGLAAGLAGALLFLSPIGGTMLAFPLFALSGLPIAIAGLAWSPFAGGIAALVAGSAILAYLAYPAAAAFFFLVGAPTAWAARLVGLSRDDPGAPGTREWYPLGRILFHGTMAIAGGTILVGLIIQFDPERLAEETSAAFADWLARTPGTEMSLSPAEAERAVSVAFAAMPFLISSAFVVILVFNLWLAARVAAASGRLARPRTPLFTAGLPAEAAAIFAIAAAASFIPGAPGEAAGAVAGAAGGAFALIGLAVLHALSLGSSQRVVMLVGAYVLIVIFGLPVFLLLVLGLAETFLQLRARRFGGAPPIQ